MPRKPRNPSTTTRTTRRNGGANSPKPAAPATATAATSLPHAAAPRPMTARPVVRTGIYSWAIVGILLLIVALGIVVGQVTLVVIPLVLALFPAAVLTPPTDALRRGGLPSAAAALLVIFGTLAVIAGLVTLLAPQVVDEIDTLSAELDRGIERLREFLQAGPFGLSAISLDQLLEQAREQIAQSEGLRSGALNIATTVGRTLAGLALALIALFFYLKDGPRISEWMIGLFPENTREDAAAVGVLSWQTIGSYIRGQLLIALVDAIGIGIGLFILRVPLALPLSVLVFFGALFPIVGAFFAGTVAVLVALASNGLLTAALVLGVILLVQQLEGNILQPLILGKATALHPLAVIAAITAGASVLGVLGAFLAVPVAASLTRAVGYLRARTPG